MQPSASRPQLPTQRVIFLDVDGVLNRAGAFKLKKQRTVDTDLLNNFKTVVSETGAQVVLASTWRHDPGGISDARQLGIPFDDVLPDLRPRSRGDEVRQWLATHATAGRYIVIDNDDDDYGSAALFQPNPHKGLTLKTARAAIAYLNGQSDRDCRRNMVARLFEWARSLVFGHRG
jgi:hypothetical protein